MTRRAIIGVFTGIVIIAGGALAADKAKPKASGNPGMPVKTVHAKPQSPRGEGADQNIKAAAAKNDKSMKVPAPASKGGEKKRGGLCGVVADNYTPWHISLYVDGDFSGAVGPWGDLDLLAISGWPTRVYARAEFSDGSTQTWGPVTFACGEAQVYRWQLDNN